MRFLQISNKRELMGVKLIDLSMEVYKGMMTYPNVAKPVIVEMETHPRWP